MCDLDNLKVEIQKSGNKKRAYLKGTNTLCGYVVALDECVRNLIVATGCSLVEAVKSKSISATQLVSKVGSVGAWLACQSSTH